MADSPLSRPYASESSVGTAIANELVKSYGFRVTDRGVDWSLENIGQSFRDEPLWTTVDWLLLGVPVARWGTAARAVTKGAGTVGQAYKAGVRSGEVVGQFPAARRGGAFAGKGPTQLGGRMVERVGRALGVERPEELAAATELYLRSPRQTPFRVALDATLGRGLQAVGATKAARWVAEDHGLFTSPLRSTLDDDYMRLVNQFGDAPPHELRQIGRIYEMERRREMGLHRRIVADSIKMWGRSGEAQVKAGGELLQQGVRPGQRIEVEGYAVPGTDLVSSVLSRRATEAYRHQFDYRMRLHEDAHDLNLIDDATHLEGYRKEGPRIYEEWVEIHERLGRLEELGADVAAIKGKRLARGGTGEAAELSRQAGRSGYARFKHRAEEAPDYLTRIMDPRASVDELGKAAWVVANQRYAQRLAGSVLSASPDDVMLMADKMFAGDKYLQRLHGVSDEMLEHARALADTFAKVGRPMQAEEVAAALGWKNLDSLFAGTKMPGYAKRLPEELRGRLLDPQAQKDVLGVMEFGEKNVTFLNRLYEGALATFRAGKTAYHPATHVRNWVGAMVMHHLATGGLPTIVPRDGIASFKAGDAWYAAAREAGIIGSAFDEEIREGLVKAYGDKLQRLPGDASSLDWLDKVMPGRFADAVTKGASKMETLYRSTDEVWKLDAFIRQAKSYQKAGSAADESYRLAARDVNKFMPNFAHHSDFGNFIRKYVPFASFTTEALRIWKNAMAEKPHLAFFWNHVVEEGTQAFGMMAGLSPQELEAAEESLPSFMRNRKLLAMPITVDGVPRFIDMSYVIPLASLVEVEQSEKLFFGHPFDLTANPVLGVAVAAAAGTDPFTGREIGPRFTERQLGIPVEDPKARRLVGLVEYMAATFLPPLMPPGYAGINLLEAARGQVSPITGEKLEDGVLKTIAANVGAIRYYAPGPESLVMNAERAERESGERIAKAWDRWEFARANGDPARMLSEQQRIVALREAFGDAPDEAEAYFLDNSPRHEAGAYANLSRRELETILGQAEALPGRSEKDRRVLSALTDRYQRMTNRGRERRKTPPRPRQATR